MSELQIVSTDSEDGKVIIHLRGPSGDEHAVKLNSMSVASLLGALRVSHSEAISSPSAEPGSMPMHRVQYQEAGETLFFRVFVSPLVFHEYTVPANTTLSEPLKVFADTYEAISMELAIHQSPDQTKN